MTERIIIAGAGGQGIMLLGKVLATAAMKENKFVTWLPAYGPEVRGGKAHCMVVVSDVEIGSPYINKADSLIIMNAPSYDKFKDRLISSGVLILNSSLVNIKPKKGRNILSYPFTSIADKLGNQKIANMVALGCFLAKTKIVDAKTVLRSIEEMAPVDKKGLVEINKQALLEGVNFSK